MHFNDKNYNDESLPINPFFFQHTIKGVNLKKKVGGLYIHTKIEQRRVL